MQVLEFDRTYHIYNCANGTEKLFLSEENYRFFLEKVKQYLIPVAEIWAYCLMPNHFHLLVRFKSEEEIGKDLAGFQNLQGLTAELKLKSPSQQLSNMLNAYAKAFNKMYHRKGSLFMRNAGRVEILDDRYLIKLIHYIHQNPKEAGLVKHLEDWKFSSYPAMISNATTLVKRNEILELFDDLENFKYVNNLPAPEI